MPEEDKLDLRHIYEFTHLVRKWGKSPRITICIKTHNHERNTDTFKELDVVGMAGEG